MLGRKAAEYWVIKSAYVDPTCRGQKIFRQLFISACTLSHTNGALGVRLYADKADTLTNAMVGSVLTRHHMLNLLYYLWVA